MDDRGYQTEVVAACGRCAAYEVKDMAVFHSVFGEALNFSIPVEIDPYYPLIGDLCPHKGNLALSFLLTVATVDGVPRTSRTCSCDAPRGICSSAPSGST
jgi:hypothetical protein